MKFILLSWGFFSFAFFTDVEPILKIVSYTLAIVISSWTMYDKINSKIKAKKKLLEEANEAKDILLKAAIEAKEHIVDAAIEAKKIIKNKEIKK